MRDALPASDIPARRARRHGERRGGVGRGEHGCDRGVRGTRRSGIAGLALLLLGGCIEPVPPAARLQPIVGGEETTEWPAVAAYLLGGGELGICTGTLVEPRAVLTAAHCAELATGEDLVLFGHSIFEPGDTVEVEAVAIHPAYDPQSGEHDLAVLTLASAAPVETPLPLNETALDESWIGTSLRVVGFGNDDVYDGTSMGLKREADVELVAVDEHLLYHETPQRNTCAGDSGGPALLDDGEGWRVAGVIAFVYPIAAGDDACEGGGGENRVDSHLDWLAGELESVEEPPDDGGGADGDGEETGGAATLSEHEQGGCRARVGGPATPAPVGALLLWLAWLGARRRRRHRPV